MDARDRLRRYLEQRRELGESEFVLDTLPVDDVLKMVGARSAIRSSRAGGDGAPPRGADARRPTAPPLEQQVSERETPEVGTRGAHAPTSDLAVPPPPAPDVRFDQRASTNWRETLRNAGAVRPAGAPPGTPSDDVPSLDPARSTAAPAANTASPTWIEALGLPVGLTTGGPAVSNVAPPLSALPTLAEVAAHIASCRSCSLHQTAQNPVPGEGNPQADFLCVGEAPGASEDEQGRPFVGEAGQLLTKILGAINLSREDVFICNVLKHRPPGNRDPLPDEVAACHPFLLRQIELVRPRVILALGRFAAQTLLQTTAAIGALRGKVHVYHGVPLIVTYHPAALLRNESWKRPTWEDVKLARRILDAARAADGVSGTL